ncbi:Aldo/keto reductase [Favolaschia claudopus]|uniref:Aldo/keto reductase n=1 Tax=Favolaschia claudopus TaxID=2862362 RepID=A0AAW0D2L1_9AGAR
MPSAIATRKIGNSTFPAIGFGIMGISTWYGKVDSDQERLKVLDAAYAAGCTFWDTSDVYGDSEDLIGQWFKRTGKRSEIFLCTKFGLKLPDFAADGSPEYVKEAVENNLRRLGVDYIDLYYLHRTNPDTPIEHTIGAMAELVKAGKVKHIGLSEVSAMTLRRAHAVHPIAAIQMEYSPFSLEIEDPNLAGGVLKTARELGVKIVAYSPLGRGVLTGQYRSPDDFEEGDLRKIFPRFSAENFPKILQLCDELKTIGGRYTIDNNPATAGQVTLAWLLAQGEDVIPIPGTKRAHYLLENFAATRLQLSSADVQTIRDLTTHALPGNRYPDIMMHNLFQDTAELS